MTETPGKFPVSAKVKARNKHPLECETCSDFGMTRDTATEFADGVTVKLGSGCARCMGTGRLSEAAA